MPTNIKNWSMTGCEGRFYVRSKNNIIWYQNGRKQRISTKLQYNRENKQIAAEKIRNTEVPSLQSNQIITLNDAVEKYIEIIKKNRSHSTLIIYINSFEFFFVKNYLITETTKITEMIEQQLLLDNKLYKSTINMYLSKIKCFFNYYIERKIILINPVLKSFKRKNIKKQIVIFTNNEINMIFTELQKENDKIYYIVIFLIYKTAFRVKEILNMKWSQIKDKNGYYDNIKLISKDKQRVENFPLNEMLIEKFNLIPETKEKIFKISYTTLYKKFNEILNKLNIEKDKTIYTGGKTIHTLRKTRISEWLFQDNLSPQIVSKLSRDRIETVMKYYANCETVEMKKLIK